MRVLPGARTLVFGLSLAAGGAAGCQTADPLTRSSPPAVSRPIPSPAKTDAAYPPSPPGDSAGAVIGATVSGVVSERFLTLVLAAVALTAGLVGGRRHGLRNPVDPRCVPADVVSARAPEPPAGAGCPDPTRTSPPVCCSTRTICRQVGNRSSGFFERPRAMAGRSDIGNGSARLALMPRGAPP